MDENATIAVEQPTYQREGSPRLVEVESRATPQDFGGGLAEGLSSFARAGDTVAATVEEASQKNDELWAQNAALQNRVNWQQKFADSQAAITQDPSKGAGFVDSFKQQYNDSQQALMQAAPTNNARNILNQHLNANGEQLFGQALGIQAKANVDWASQSYLASTDNIKQLSNQTTVSLDKDGNFTSTNDDLRKQLSAAGDSASGVLPTTAVRGSQMQMNKFLDAQDIAASTMQLGAGQTALLLSQGKIGSNMDLPERQQKIMELSRQQQEDTNTARRDSIQSLKDLNMEIQNSGSIDPVKATQVYNGVFSAFGGEAGAGKAYAAEAMKSMMNAGDIAQADKTYQVLTNEATERYPTGEDRDNLLRSLGDPNHVATQQEISDASILYAKQGNDSRETLGNVQELQNNINQQIQDSQNFATLKSQAQGTSGRNVQEMSQQLLEQNPKDPVAKSFASWADNRNKLLREDPFALASSENASVSTMLNQEAQIRKGNSPQLTAPDTDPINNLLGQDLNKILAPSDQERADGMHQSAIAKSLSVQSDMGIADDKAAVMSKDESQAWNQALVSAKSGQEMTGILQQIHTRFGPYENQAFAQMHNDKDNPLPPAFGLVAANRDKPFVNDLANSLLIPDGKGKDDNAGYKQLFEKAGKADDEKAIESAIQKDPLLTQYQDANAAASNTQQTMDMVNETKDATTKFAKYLYLNPPPGSSYSAQEAVDAAVKNAIGSHVDFGNSNGRTYLINRDDPRGGSYSDDQTQTIKDQLTKEQNALSGDKDTYWVTRADLSGVTLYAKPTEGISREGIPIPNSFRSFEDMKNKGAQVKENEPNLIQRTFDKLKPTPFNPIIP